MLQSFNPKYMLFGCVRNNAFRRALSTDQYQSALLALKSYAVPSRVVLQCGDSLQELALSNRIRLVWVPGHCGIHAAAFAGPEPCLPLTPSSVKRRERE
jgi:hypothetical protein